MQVSVVEAYAYMHKVNPNIFPHFLSFYLCITSFHCSHAIPIFSEIFPIFLPILFTSKACHFDMALLVLLPFKHPG